MPITILSRHDRRVKLNCSLLEAKEPLRCIPSSSDSMIRVTPHGERRKNREADTRRSRVGARVYRGDLGGTSGVMFLTISTSRAWVTPPPRLASKVRMTSCEPIHGISPCEDGREFIPTVDSQNDVHECVKTCFEQNLAQVHVWRTGIQDFALTVRLLHSSDALHYPW